MTLEFDKLPRFKHESIKIVTLVAQWAFALKAPEEAIIQQVYTAHVWANSNPKKAPKKNVTRFLDSWMKAAQRHGNLVVRKAVVPREADKETDMSFEEMREIRRKNLPNMRV